MSSWLLLLGVAVTVAVTVAAADDDAGRPCAARAVPGRSVLCVCNATYCDETPPAAPPPATCLVYTSTKGGLRFHKTQHSLQYSSAIPISDFARASPALSLVVEPGTTYQTVEGFGGAVTDAAAINWKSLSEPLQRHLIDSYFSASGLAYNMARVPIAGSDFSTRAYSYNDLPVGDVALNNFSLAYEDHLYKIPMIKAIMETSVAPVHIVATTWAPPVWMKSNAQVSGRSALRKEYYQAFAEYHLKFLEKYAEQGIPVWGLTTTNEPINGDFYGVKFNSLGWSASDMGKWIIENFGPTIRNSNFSHVKIMTVDDQRYTIPYFFNLMVELHGGVLRWLDGVAVHFYSDGATSPELLQWVARTDPRLFVLSTEASAGAMPWEESVVLGSWNRAVHYIYDIITDLNYNVIGWIDWNLCLDKHGGPNWSNNFVDAAVIVLSEQEFVKQPVYYAMGHFSKFIARGSRRVHVRADDSPLTKTVINVAFLTPDHHVVVVLYSNEPQDEQVKIKLGRAEVELTLEPSSVTTVVFPYAP